MLVHEFLERSAERFPDKTSLVAGSQRLTYRDINERANKLAHALRAAGVTYGDRVVVILDNSPEAVVSIFGISKADAVFSVVNPTIKEDKLAYILNNCRATALITHETKWQTVGVAAAKAEHIRAVFLVAKDTASKGHEAEERKGDPVAETSQSKRDRASKLRYRLVPWHEALNAQPASAPPRRAIDIDLAALIYTSGTTGNPKGVMMTHQNVVAASTSITTYLENTDRDIILSVLPLSFDYGLYQIIMSAQFGGTVVLEKAFLYPYAVINMLQKERITGFPLVPTISAILIQMKEIKNERFEHLRYITNTAAALPPSHIRGLRELFPTAAIFSMYGLTECKRVSFLPPGELDRRPTSVGKGMPNEHVYLVDENDRVITEPDVVGELVVRGANVMKGYWELPEATDRMLRPGPYPWEKVLYTGDLFKMDEEGFLYFVSRKDDIIKSRGEKVSPKEIENVLYELDGIVEAAVVGVPDEVLGESIKAYVVLKEGSTLSPNDILAHCAKHLEDFMIPQHVELRTSLPKTSTGKITKKGL